MSDIILCPVCSESFVTTPTSCSKCSFPFSGSEEERGKFIGQNILKKSTISDASDGIKKARNILLIIAVANTISTAFIYAEDDFVLAAISGALSIVFFVLAGLTKKMPLPSILIAIALLLFFYTTDAIVDPDTLIRGLLWKIVFLSGLFYALSGVLKARKIEAQNPHLREISEDEDFRNQAH